MSLEEEGPRVLVTRAAEDAAGLAHAFGRMGLHAVLVPLLERAWDPAAVLAAVASHPTPDVVFVTSGTAAQILGALVPTAWSDARWVAVGPATAARLEGLGFRVDYVPKRATAMDLARGLDGLDGSTVIYPKADLADPATSLALRARGAHVVDVIAYRNGCPDRAAADLLAALPVHATPIMSGSAARRLAEHIPQERWGELGRIVAIGPTAARVAQSMGLSVYAVASPHTAAGMVAQTARALGMRLAP